MWDCAELCYACVLHFEVHLSVCGSEVAWNLAEYVWICLQIFVDVAEFY